ncbi:MAG: BirA family transcriptional regulator [Mycobacterium sp.]|jgi:BirA family biotin operon repressor/biotin-[acetyl-CoA-carboxylase] ligase|nr:biotin--acetyl-CoA-carboxylase ligase [Mycobacterium sp.]MDT5134938.1 BirA family transcriptional regulator [Mycobacterium sp.]
MRREPLDVESLRRALGAPWGRLDVVADTGSTNADLLARAAAGEDIDGAVLIAEHQTAGRGRNNRSWSTAPRAQLTMSVGVGTADVPAAAWGWLPLATGVAVVDAVADVTGVGAGLKWPNDVLVGDRKLAGILAEVPRQSAIVVGIGLNVTLTPEEAGDPAATSLLDLGVDQADRNVVARRLLGHLARRVAQWRTADPELAKDYRSHSLTIGTPVRAILPGDREVVGTARSVDEQGRLRIGTEDGQTVAVSAGDVVHLRPSL